MLEDATSAPPKPPPSNAQEFGDGFLWGGAAITFLVGQSRRFMLSDPTSHVLQAVAFEVRRAAVLLSCPGRLLTGTHNAAGCRPRRVWNFVHVVAAAHRRSVCVRGGFFLFPPALPCLSRLSRSCARPRQIRAASAQLSRHVSKPARSVARVCQKQRRVCGSSGAVPRAPRTDFCAAAHAGAHCTAQVCFCVLSMCLGLCLLC